MSIGSHGYSGRPLRSRIQLSPEVRNVEKIYSGWILHVDGDVPESLQRITLAVAFGSTSSPKCPTFPVVIIGMYHFSNTETLGSTQKQAWRRHQLIKILRVLEEVSLRQIWIVPWPKLERTLNGSFENPVEDLGSS